MERDGINWAELALPAAVVAAAAPDGVNGDMLRELQSLLHSAAFKRALKARMLPLLTLLKLLTRPVSTKAERGNCLVHCRDT